MATCLTTDWMDCASSDRHQNLDPGVAADLDPLRLIFPVKVAVGLVPPRGRTALRSIDLDVLTAPNRYRVAHFSLQ